MQSVYVLGNAPSLTDHLKITDLKKEITIGCNHLYRSGFIPSYYVVWDINFFNTCPNDFLDLDTKFIFPEHVGVYLLKTRQIQRIKQLLIVKESSINFFKRTKFSTTVSFTKNSITSLAIPFAVSLNPKEIHVMGVESGLTITNEHYHFYPEYDISEVIAKKLGVPHTPRTPHENLYNQKVWKHTRALIKNHQIKLVLYIKDKIVSDPI